MTTEIGDHPQQQVDDGWPSPISRAGSLAIGEPEALHPAPLVIGLPTRKPLQGFSISSVAGRTCAKETSYETLLPVGGVAKHRS